MRNEQTESTVEVAGPQAEPHFPTEIARLQAIQKVNRFGSVAHREAYEAIKALVLHVKGVDIGGYYD